MKQLLLWVGILASLTSCSKGNKVDPTPSDPLLGHWQSETLRDVQYDATGKVTSDQSTTIPSQLDVTATTMTFTSVVNGKTSKEVGTYTRTGELLVVTPPSGNAGKETVYARGLTTNSFTMEFNGERVSGKSYYIQSIPYHR